MQIINFKKYFTDNFDIVIFEYQCIENNIEELFSLFLCLSIYFSRSCCIRLGVSFSLFCSLLVQLSFHLTVLLSLKTYFYFMFVCSFDVFLSTSHFSTLFLLLIRCLSIRKFSLINEVDFLSSAKVLL
jgi:hypothetical protein